MNIFAQTFVKTNLMLVVRKSVPYMSINKLNTHRKCISLVPAVWQKQTYLMVSDCHMMKSTNIQLLNLKNSHETDQNSYIVNLNSQMINLKNNHQVTSSRHYKTPVVSVPDHSPTQLSQSRWWAVLEKEEKRTVNRRRRSCRTCACIEISNQTLLILATRIVLFHFFVKHSRRVNQSAVISRARYSFMILRIPVHMQVEKFWQRYWSFHPTERWMTFFEDWRKYMDVSGILPLPLPFKPS